MLLSFGVTITRLHSGLVATIVGLQALRVVTQILVCAMAVNSRITFPKKTGDEEESSPLLGQRSQAPDDSADPQQPVGDNGYGSILPNQNKPKAGNDKADGDEEVKNQSTIDYIKSFRVGPLGLSSSFTRQFHPPPFPFFLAFVLSCSNELSGPSSISLANWENPLAALVRGRWSLFGGKPGTECTRPTSNWPNHKYSQ